MRKLIGDKAFYKMVLLVAIPIMVQNGITNFVSLLDNIMVGRVGTAQMSGVAIANQLLFVFNLAILAPFLEPASLRRSFLARAIMKAFVLQCAIS